ncbi:MAG: hypothetical protein ACQGVK_18470 [Myxococcota bacterium]
MSKRPTPIYSTREDDPEIRDSLDEFVVHLAERIDLLQDAEGAGDLPQLRALAELLSEDALLYGFPDLADLASLICRCCQEDKPENARDVLTEATEVARRVRLGHRGAL